MSSEKEKAKVFGKEMDKVERYGWRIIDEPGRFSMIDKRVLSVDSEYQRLKVVRARITRIAARWSWAACGCLTVGMRPDGSLWVIDGQHRKLAADERSDIQELPCLIFQVEKKREEALTFLNVNADRGPLKMVEKFRSLLEAQDPTAVAIRKLIESTGRRVSNWRGNGSITCVKALMDSYQRNASLTEDIWFLAVEIFQEKSIPGDIFKGLFYLEFQLRKRKKDEASLFRAINRRKLVQIGPEELRQKINAMRAAQGRGGERIYAEGIVAALNKGRSTNRLPTMMS